MSDIIEMGALLSDCGKYRYRLSRTWDSDLPNLPFIMLNPSIADDVFDDPTIRRCIGFARRENLGGIVVANLYGLRSTSPAVLKTTIDPIGPDNEKALREVIIGAVAQSVPIVCAWGATAPREASHLFIDIARHHGANLVCLGKTANGSPRHPLYVKSNQPLEFFVIVHN